MRANENIALTATHTLFAREHNRIVALLPSSLSQEDEVPDRPADRDRRAAVHHLQRVPAGDGRRLPAYQGYNPNVNANLGNEFATVGYRAHSMIHGEIEIETDADRYTQATLDALEARASRSRIDGDEVELAVPLNVAFFNPDLLGQIQLGPLLQGIGLESRSTRTTSRSTTSCAACCSRCPVSGNPECLDGPTLPECFHGVVDLGAIDIERGRDHGMPSYNQLRQAFGLPAKTSFTAITGESTESFPTRS